MTGDDWQVRARARRLRLYASIGLLIAVGGVSGFLVGYNEGDGGLVAAGNIPAWVAIVAVAAFLFAMTFGSYAYFQATDELDRRQNLICTAVSGAVTVIGYPCWFILWKGGLVNAPDAGMIFLASVFIGAAYYGYAKLTS